MKSCSKCQKRKPTSEFHRNRAQPDGFANQCKLCFQGTHREYRHTEGGRSTRKAYRTSEVGHAVQKESCARYDRSDKGKAAKRRYVATPGGAEASRRSSRKYASISANRQKLRAHWAVNHKIRNDKMPKVATLTCDKCKETAACYHHHRGYEKKHYYDVIPLCKQCHYDTHNIPY